MASHRVGKRLVNKTHSPSRSKEPGQPIQRRQARVTVKYDRRELQRRLDVEKWIDLSLEALYAGRETHMPDEVNIDDLLDLVSDEERSRTLQITLESCTNSTESFIQDLLLKLKGLQTETLLKRSGLEGQSEEQVREHA